MVFRWFSGESQCIPVPNMSYGSVSKPWYLVNPKIAGKWMFITLKCIYRYWPIPIWPSLGSTSPCQTAKGLDRPNAPGLAGLERTVHSSAIFHEFRGPRGCIERVGLAAWWWKTWRSNGDFFRYSKHVCWDVGQRPSGKLTVCYWKWPFIVGFPIHNGDFP